MDKVYITKDELSKSFNTQREKAGPLVQILVVFGLCISILWSIPLIVFWIVFFVFCVPFFVLDKMLFRRNK